MADAKADADGRRTWTLCIRRTLCRHVTIGTPMVIFAVLTVFWLFLTIGTLLVHCWYSLGRHVTIGTPMVKNSQETIKTAQMTIGVPIVTCLPRLYQQCSNSVPIVKLNSQNSKNHCWCTNRHMSTQSPPNTQSRIKCTYQVKTSVCID